MHLVSSFQQMRKMLLLLPHRTKGVRETREVTPSCQCLTHKMRDSCHNLMQECEVMGENEAPPVAPRTSDHLGNGTPNPQD